jgi:chromate transport protein ChrA
MGTEWAGRWGGAACAVAGCVPLLFTLVAGTGAAVASASTQMMMTTPVATATLEPPAWVRALASASWPLLAAAVVLIVWSFWRTTPLPRALAYAAAAVLIANRLHMTAWLFFPAMALLAAGFVVAQRARRLPNWPH